jgi:hypothetical protein
MHGINWLQHNRREQTHFALFCLCVDWCALKAKGKSRIVIPHYGGIKWQSVFCMNVVCVCPFRAHFSTMVYLTTGQSDVNLYECAQSHSATQNVFFVQTGQQKVCTQRNCGQRDFLEFFTIVSSKRKLVWKAQVESWAHTVIHRNQTKLTNGKSS